MTAMLQALVQVVLLLLMPPLMLGIINRVKALFAGRQGQPLLQTYYDLAKLLQKGAVYSRTTTWLFRAGPIVALSTAILAGLLVPLTGSRSPLGFEGDVVAFAYLLALGRFFTMAAALDTGSAFEGMGASREAAFSAYAEPALFFALTILCMQAGAVSFGDALSALPWTSWGAAHPVFLIAAGALFVVLLSENSRIPVDDPNTHLELTMVHEVMVLDHGGPDLAFIVYGAAIKLFAFGAILVHLMFPVASPSIWQGALVMIAGQAVVAVGVGVVESTLARLRLVRVPQLLIGAAMVAAIGVAVLLYRGNP